MMHLSIIGGGPAGMRAAEVAAQGGAEVTLYDAKPSVGRKFLVAGRGGLNLTHGEPMERFEPRFSGAGQPSGIWQSMLTDFGPDALRRWAAELGVETFQATSGRVYPREMKAAPLLRRWVQRLRDLGVVFAMNHRWTGLRHGDAISLEFMTPDGPRSSHADAVVLALGGASWPQTGSDGSWVSILESHGISVSRLLPANCGWEFPWSDKVLAEAEGKPLKNIVVSVGEEEVVGELLVTRYGLEGGAIYQLGKALRGMKDPVIHIDFKPTFTIDQLVAKLDGVRRDWFHESVRRWRLSDACAAILSEMHGNEPWSSVRQIAQLAKCCNISLVRPRPIAEAISSAGGVCWAELDQHLMLVKIPSVYVAGEMIDWEAPTGGYLMQGCFATGTRAARSALARCHRQ